MNGRGSGNTGGDDNGRKRLASRQKERPVETTEGSRNEARDGGLLSLMFGHGIRVSEAFRLKLD